MWIFLLPSRWDISFLIPFFFHQNLVAFKMLELSVLGNRFWFRFKINVLIILIYDIYNLPIFVVPWFNTIAKSILYKKNWNHLYSSHNTIFPTAPAKVLTSDSELCSIAKAHYCMHEAAYKWDSEHCECLPTKCFAIKHDILVIFINFYYKRLIVIP